MKITAIRLAEVGRFSLPVALEGLSGGLDILAGPNEAGKSTILAALRVAFGEKHSGNSKDVRDLQPYTGGSPLVEVEFVAAGARWRLRKRFLQGRFAELRNIDSGAIERNASAETRLAELIAGPAAFDRFPLLWVGQGDSLLALQHKTETVTSLRGLVAGEVAAMAGDDTLRRVQARVLAELERFETAKTRKATGDYILATKARDKLRADRDEAIRRRDNAGARLERLAAANMDAGQRRAPERVAERRRVHHVATAALAAAEKTMERVREGELKEKAETAELRTAADALAQLEARRADLARIASVTAPLTQTLQAAAANQAATRATLDHAEAALAAADRALDAAHKTLADARLANALSAATKALQAATVIAAEHARAKAALAACTITPPVYAALQQHAANLARLDARLSAVAPDVAIALAPGAAGRIHVDGVPLAATRTFTPTAPLVLDIKGIGRITVSPAGGADLARDRTDAAALRARLEAGLQGSGAVDLEHAATLLEARRTAETTERVVRTQLEAAAPAGVESLAIDHARVALAAAAIGAKPMALAAAEPLHEAAIAGRAGAETSRRQADQAHAAAATTHTRLQAEVTALDKQRDDFVAALGDDAEARMAALRVAKNAAAALLSQTVRELSAWRETAPDAARLAALRHDVERAAAAIELSDTRLAELDLDISGLEGELRAEREDDVEGRAGELTAEHAVAEARVAEMELEIAALRLLASEFAAADAARRATIVQPVLARIRPYLATVFPDARLDLDGDLQPHKLVRAGRDEDLHRLSRGTQEQIAVLARLGLGRLLAEHGAAVPLILDDALVYADDFRVVRMFKALALASEAHQVIVLTCRAATFGGLHGHRLELKPWQP